MSGLVNKVKESLHSSKNTETGTPVTGHNDPEGIHGNHNSRMANAADPRIDSDRDNRAAPHTTGTHHAPGTSGHHHTAGHPGTSATGGAYSGGMGDAQTGTFTTNTGAVPGGHSGVTGYDDPTGTHGSHNSRMANAADPRFDSDRDHRGAPGAMGTSHIGSGPGAAPNTAGPHKSDMLNKADPRVDSDLDGSKTFGGNKTLS